MIRACTVAVFALFSGLATNAVRAEDAAPVKPISKTIGQLLGEGYRLHSITVIDQATARRMSQNDSWQDDLLLTLTRDGDFAFCNFALNVVTSGIGMKNAPCSVAQ